MGVIYSIFEFLNKLLHLLSVLFEERVWDQVQYTSALENVLLHRLYELAPEKE